MSFLLYNLPILLLAIPYRRRLSLSWLIYFSILASSYGYYIITTSDAFAESGAWIVLLAPSLFLFGCILKSTFKEKEPKKDVPISDITYHESWPLIVGVICLLSLYHFFKVGIVIFNANPEIARFTSINGSGLFGIPGRCVLFGLPILSIIGVVYYQHLNRFATNFLFSIYFVSQLATGFKSGIFEFSFVILMGYLIRRREEGSLIQKKIRKRLFIGLGSTALIYGAWVSDRYISNKSSNSFSLSYIFNRVTVESAYPQWIALSNQSLTKGMNAFGTDLSYFMQKYFHIPTHTGFAFDQLTSVQIYHTPLSVNAFIVPVTIGAPGYLIRTVGTIFAPLFLIIFGYMFQAVTHRITDTNKFKVVLTSASVTFAIHLFSSNGGGAYLLINIGFIWVFVILLHLLYISQFKLRLSTTSSIHGT